MFKKWEDLVKNKKPELKGFCAVEMTFTSMDKGKMHYRGLYKDMEVYCSVSECYVIDYNYAATETVGTVTQGEYVYLTLNNEEILNTH